MPVAHARIRCSHVNVTNDERQTNNCADGSGQIRVDQGNASRGGSLRMESECAISPSPISPCPVFPHSHPPCFESRSPSPTVTNNLSERRLAGSTSGGRLHVHPPRERDEAPSPGPFGMSSLQPHVQPIKTGPQITSNWRLACVNLQGSTSSFAGPDPGSTVASARNSSINTYSLSIKIGHSSAEQVSDCVYLRSIHQHQVVGFRS
jgi:hypothetical protein